MANNTNADLLKQYCKGKSADQVKVIEYFCKQEGCLSKNMSDDEYSAMVIKKRDSLNLRQKALNKIAWTRKKSAKFLLLYSRVMYLRTLLQRSVLMVTG